jgi:23S rRNA G2445 N2-methylase RlmL
MFATAIPGLGALVSRELTGRGVRPTGTGSDGRSDIVLFEARPDEVRDLRTVEDVFVEIGRTLRSEGDRPQWISKRLWKPARVQAAVAIRGRARPPTFRVVARVLQERSFLRTELRRHFSGQISRERPQWQFADPATLEFWVSEYRSGRFVAGLRITDSSMRQHGGRAKERSGALRPTVAAAMVGLAGSADGVLLDPCCGSGTILREARTAGWSVAGSDIDAAAVEIARRNLGDPGAVAVADARSLDRPDSSVAACVANLPFGQQYSVDEPMTDWLRAVLGELARITRRGGRIVLLAPKIPATVDNLHRRERYPLTLLGTRTAIWVYDRR